MAKLTRSAAQNRGAEPALIDEFGAATWSELDDRVNRLISALRSAGLAENDTIAVVVGNRREWFEIALACAHGGWTYVPVNWHCVADELAYVLEDAGAKAVFCDYRFAGVVAAALLDRRAKDVEIVVGAPDEIGRGLEALSQNARFVSYNALLAAGRIDEPEAQTLGGPMFYTSGTTGRPKGVRGMLSGGGRLAPETLQLIASGFSQYLPIPGRTFLCGPFYHSAQWAFSFFPLIAGSSVVMRHKFDAADALEVIDRERVTNVHLVPTQMKRLLDLPENVRKKFDGSSLKIVWHGGAPCPPSVKRAMIEWWGPKISEYYGSTEGSIISTIGSSEWLAKGGSVGRPVPTIEVILVDENGQRIADNADGALYFRSKLGADFSYHKDAAKTAAAHLEPGLFTTGDVGHLDSEGYLWLTDRRIDMIISGGVNIYPAEIEGVIAGFQGVADVAVIGVPDDEYGESVKAIVELENGIVDSPTLADDLRQHCRALLSGYKVPKSFEFVASIPRSGAGKILKGALREPYWAGRKRLS